VERVEIDLLSSDRNDVEGGGVTNPNPLRVLS